MLSEEQAKIATVKKRKLEGKNKYLSTPRVGMVCVKTNVVKRRQKQKKEEITIRHGTQPYNKSLFNTCQRYTTGEKHVVAYVVFLNPLVLPFITNTLASQNFGSSQVLLCCAL